MGYTQLSALYACLGAAESACRSAGNETGGERVVLDEPTGCPEAKVALDSHNIASREALRAF